jgi:UDP-GlcNAc:undecaprenyl-phosphate GlcNAc-1-phosphate transferase
VQEGTERTTTSWSTGFDEAGPDLFRARYSLLGERPDEGMVEFGWTDGRTLVDRDTEIAIELLCEHALGALARIEAARARESGEKNGKVIALKR